MESIMTKPEYSTRNINDLKDLLEQSVALYSDRDAFIKKTRDTYVGVTYKKFKEDIFSLGTKLLELSIKGERVILLTEPRYEACVTFLAVACSGGMIVPLSLNFEEDELVDKINQVGARFIVFSKKYKTSVNNIFTKCKTLKYGIDLDAMSDDTNSYSFLKLIDLGNKCILNGDNSFAKLELDNKDIATILFSNRNSLGVMLSHNNLVSSIMAISSIFPMEDDDRSIILSSFDSVIECVNNFLMMIYFGATVCFNEDDKKILSVLEELKPSVITFSDELFEKFYNDLWQSIGNMPEMRKTKLLMFLANILRKFNIDIRRKLFGNILKNCGENLSRIIVFTSNPNLELFKSLNTFGIDVFFGYGQVETSSFISLNKIGSIKEKSIGRPIPELKLSINNTNERGVGEIILKGDMVTFGYYNNKKLTNDIIKDGFLRTGVIGYQDKNGYIVLTGKKKFKRH